MNLRTPILPLKLPSRQWNPEDQRELLRTLNNLITNIFNPGDIVCSSLRIFPYKENGYGLPVGGVYVDGDGFLKIVRPGDAFAPTFLVKVTMRPVVAA